MSTGPSSSHAAMPSTRARRLREASLGPALTRYRVMAIVTGVLLVLVFTNLGVRGVTSLLGDEVHLAGSWLAVTHGWVYIVYLATVVDMWSRLRWGAGRLAGLVLAGVLPGVSFEVERRVTREVTALLRQIEEGRTEEVAGAPRLSGPAGGPSAPGDAGGDH